VIKLEWVDQGCSNVERRDAKASQSVFCEKGCQPNDEFRSPLNYRNSLLRLYLLLKQRKVKRKSSREQKGKKKTVGEKKDPTKINVTTKKASVDEDERRRVQASPLRRKKRRGIRSQGGF